MEANTHYSNYSGVSDDSVCYSSDKIREIRAQCADLLRVMEERADLIRRASCSVTEESRNGDDPGLSAIETGLRQMIENYRTQIDHLETAADLYEKCSREVYLNAEQVIQKGGSFH